MKYFITVIGFLLVALSLVAVLMTQASGVGLVIALLILVLTGFTALSGNLKYALIVLLITTLNTAFLSLSIMNVWPKGESEPLPEGLRPMPPPSFDLNFTQSELEEISKSTGLSVDEVRNIPVEPADGVLEDKNVIIKNVRAFFMIVKIIALPYLFTLFLMWFGYKLRMSKYAT